MTARKGSLQLMAHPRLTSLVCALGGAAVTLSMVLGAPCVARAETVEELEAKVEELGKKVDEAAQSYAKAIANVQVLDGSIAENEAKIDAVENEIPEQKARSASAIRSLYKMSQNRNGLLELLLTADDFNSFLTTMTYLNAIEDRNTEEAAKLASLQNELATTQAELEAQRSEAESQREAADAALKEAEDLRQQAIEAAARKAAEEAARKAAEEQARSLAGSADVSALADAVQNAAPQNQPRPQQTPQGFEPPAPSEPGDANRSEFVQEWTQRIDDYLAGSPLAGHGRTFAEAAYDYGVDPRWSPAISNTESTKGRYCFLPHNAWGWGSSSWPDWDTAIREHIRGLSAGYGYTISEANAQKYCPPTWQDWYYATLSEMAKI